MREYVSIQPAEIEHGGEVWSGRPLWPGEFAKYEGGYLEMLTRMVRTAVSKGPFDPKAARDIIDQMRALAFQHGTRLVSRIGERASGFQMMRDHEKELLIDDISDLIDAPEKVSYVRLVLKKSIELNTVANRSRVVPVRVLTMPRDASPDAFPLYTAVKEAFIEGRDRQLAAVRGTDADPRIVLQTLDFTSTVHVDEYADEELGQDSEDDVRSTPLPLPQVYDGVNCPTFAQLGTYYGQVVEALKAMPRLMSGGWKLEPRVVKWGADNNWNVRIGFVNRTGEWQSPVYLEVPPPAVTRKPEITLEDCRYGDEGRRLYTIPRTSWKFVRCHGYDSTTDSFDLDEMADDVLEAGLIPTREPAPGVLINAEFGFALRQLRKCGVIERSASGDETFTFRDDAQSVVAIVAPSGGGDWVMEVDGQMAHRISPGYGSHLRLQNAVASIAANQISPPSIRP